MKKIKTVIFFLTLLCINNVTTAQEIITNKEVLQMKDLGFDDTIIIEKINTSNVDFDTSITALTELKKAGLSSDVISVIMRSTTYDNSLKAGIYYTDATEEPKLILASVFSASNKNSVASSLVSGFIPSTKKAILPGASSKNVINKRSPTFKFIFEPEGSENNDLQNIMSRMGMLNWWFRTAKSPNEFILIKLDVNKRKKLREVITGKSSIAFSNDGVDSKYIVDFEIETIDEYTFKVKTKNLEVGEYAFMYQGQVPMGAENQSIFDFSVE